MKQLAYSGSFLSCAGVTWTVEILCESGAVPLVETEKGELDFEAEEALVIEWGNTEKHQVMQGSTATLRIDSPGDRTYQNLYSVAPGEIRADVLRNGELYWSGTLDPEFYEEPYERKNHYTVSLTFSDFGILDRKKYNLRGYVTLHDVVSHCLAEAGISYTGIVTNISTSLNGGNALQLDDVSVRSDNFYDEDGEALSLREVLEGVLQPLGLRMIQRNGNVEIYDLNSLAGTTSPKSLVWCGDSSLMSVDRVYNNAKITWSTYAVSGNMVSDHCYIGAVNRNFSALNEMGGLECNGSLVFTYHYSTDIAKWIDAKDYGFSMWTNRRGINASIVNSNAAFYKIVPQYDGTESEGIAIYWKGVRARRENGPGGGFRLYYNEAQKGMSLDQLKGNLSSAGTVIFRTARMDVPSVSTPESLKIKIGMELLFDPRFNPYEQAVNILEGASLPKNYHAQKDYQEEYKKQVNFLYVPVKILFRNDNGETYCWSNKEIVAKPHISPVTLIDDTMGRWKTDAPGVWGYLCYYDPQDRKENSGIGQGFALNRPAINPHIQQLSSVLENFEGGQAIPYPPYGKGEIWVEILDGGWILADGDTDLSESETPNPYEIWGNADGANKINWILAQLPQIEIVNNQQFDAAISTDDVEYNSELNPSAKESIELETICGTKEGGVPTARGAYYNGSTQITEFTRAGRTAQAEELLIGTLYSQYAERHTTLSGEVEILTGGVTAYTEGNQGSKLFIVSGDVQDVITDTSDAVFVELSPDEYDKKK